MGKPEKGLDFAISILTQVRIIFGGPERLNVTLGLATNNTAFSIPQPQWFAEVPRLTNYSNQQGGNIIHTNQC